MKSTKDCSTLKGKNKLRISFESHCVDSWVLANQVVGGHTEPDNIKVGYYKPLIFYRRQLHDSCPKKGNIRRRYGGTISLGLKKGTLVKHPKHGFCLIGGSLGERLSLSHLETNKRLCKNAKKEDLIILSNLKWNIK